MRTAAICAAAALALIAGLDTSTSAQKGKSTGNTNANAMTIFPVGPYGLQPDQVTDDGPVRYVSAQVVTPPGEPCVSIGYNNTGFTAAYPGRRYDDGTFCNANLAEEARRTYRITFPPAMSGPGAHPCDVLGVARDGTGGCSVTTDPVNYQRIQMGGLFSKKPNTSHVTAMVRVPDANVMYMLQTDTAGPVNTDPENPNVRTVTYAGTARLLGPTDATSTWPEATGPFAFACRISVEKCPTGTCSGQ